MSFSSVEDLIQATTDPAKICEFLGTGIDPDMFAYVGFDHTKIIGKLKTLKERNKIDDQKFKAHIEQIVGVGLKRGNIRSDQLASFPHVKALQMLYEIKVVKYRGEKISLSPYDLTFVRGVKVFPTVASTLIHRFPDRFLNPKLGHKFGAKHLPIELRHSGAAALIPRGKIGELYFELHVAYMMEYSLLINRNVKGIGELYETQKRYGMLAWSSSVVEDEDRVRWFKTFGLHKLNVFRDVVKGVNEMFKVVGKALVDVDEYAEFINGDVVIFVTKDEDSKVKEFEMEGSDGEASTSVTQ